MFDAKKISQSIELSKVNDDDEITEGIVKKWIDKKPEIEKVGSRRLSETNLRKIYHIISNEKKTQK